MNHKPARRVLVGTFHQPIILYVFSEGCGTKGDSKDGWMEKTIETPVVGLHAVVNSQH